MRWFNFVGWGMLTLAVILDEWLYLYLWEEFNVGVVVAAAIYLVVAIGLSVWGGRSTDSD
ncbi:MAG: hypothetical protein NNA20_02560 [Nitrospira sp.]|nr:hypothetical protein [Nitrospira sp.]MCP9441452.1 hypothetical protein [Nitrospira sp.]